MDPLVQRIEDRGTEGIAHAIEAAVRTGELAPGARLPTVRRLAEELRVSPNTVASAYKLLRSRGLLLTRGRRGTRVSARPPIAVTPAAEVPPSVRNLADGNPDPARFPRLERVISSIDLSPRLYGEEANDSDLVELAAEDFRRERIPLGPVAIVGGALDAIERILRAELRPGDGIALEDPCYSGILDLVRALGLTPVPVAIDDRGAKPGSLLCALDRGTMACILTPRAQNPSGAALDAARARELREILDPFPGVLVIEDDHAGPVAGVPAHSVCRADRARWAITRSVAKWLGPDLRLAILTGDPATVSRVQGRQMIGAGWVSGILQKIVAALWRDPEVRSSLRGTAKIYGSRRRALIDALAGRGIEARGRSGLNVWVPVPDESRVVGALYDRGFAVTGGERFRIESPPAVRVTTTTLRRKEIEPLADAFAQCLASAARTRSA